MSEPSTQGTVRLDRVEDAIADIAAGKADLVGRARRQREWSSQGVRNAMRKSPDNDRSSMPGSSFWAGRRTVASSSACSACVTSSLAGTRGRRLRAGRAQRQQRPGVGPGGVPLAERRVVGVGLGQ